ATGTAYWTRDVAAEVGAKPPMWGFSGSPLVVDGMVMVFAGGEGGKDLLAYRATSGESAWTAPAGTISYSSPQLATLSDTRKCLLLPEGGLTAVDPATGRVLWKAGSASPGAPRTVQ